MYVVEDDGHAVARCFGQTDIPRNYALEHLRTEETSEIGRDLFRERGAVVIHRQQNSFDCERRVDCAAQSRQRIEQLGNTLEGQEFALNWDEHRIAGCQSIHRKNVERGRAVYQDKVVFLAERIQSPASGDTRDPPSRLALRLRRLGSCLKESALIGRSEHPSLLARLLRRESESDRAFGGLDPWRNRGRWWRCLGGPNRLVACASRMRQGMRLDLRRSWSSRLRLFG